MPITPKRLPLCSFRAAILLLVLLSACGRERALRPSNQTPVFLISIDTLRSDRLPAYGYRGVATPAIDRLRADGILFEHAYSHCPLTLPSHATVLTGRLPADTGIRDNIGYQLAPTVPTLAEVLGKNGYRTGAAVSSFVLRRNTRIDRGFDFYDDAVEQQSAGTAIGEIQRAGPKTAAIARKWIGENAANPLFFLLHLYEPHSPYEPPEPFRGRYAQAYDGEVAAADHVVGEFLDFLRERDLYDRSLIVLFSDHGEGLGDHGEEEHGIFLYREAIQVPLLVKLPGGAMRGRSVATAVQLSDIFPTVTELTGTKSAAVPATSLLAFLKDGAEAAERFVYSESYYPRFHFGWSDLHSLTDGRKHLIQAPRPELYDLRGDTAERTNVLQQERRAYAAMRTLLQRLIREAAAPAAIDSEEAAKLAALGYLGAGAQIAPGEALPDPKDSIGAFADVRRAFTLGRRGETEEALAVTEKLLAGNPRMLDLWDLKARLLGVQRRQREAIEAAKEGLRLAPNATHLALLVATLSLEVGELDDAERHAALAMRIEPARAHDLLARVWIARGDLARAEREARASLASQKDRALAFVTLGRVQKERGDHEAALRSFDAAAAALGERANRTINSLHYLRGDTLARLGRIDEAERAFREEIRLFPEEPRAYRNLVLLYVSGGKTAEATAVLHELIERSPTPLAYFAVIDVLKAVGDERGVQFWARKARQRFPSDRRF